MMCAVGNRLVLGIDAAWTERGSAGFALVECAGSKSRLLALGRSAAEFITTLGDGGSRVQWQVRVRRCSVTIANVLDAVARHAGRRADIISLDIPLSPLPIAGSRAADRAVARRYWRQDASPYTPRPNLPGTVSAKLFEALREAGHGWVEACDIESSGGRLPCFIETYPHPAIVELAGLRRRLRYKVDNRARYWKREGAECQWLRVAGKLSYLRRELDAKISGVAEAIPSAVRVLPILPKRLRKAVLKGIEDSLDAVVCAWVGCEFLANRTTAYGDGTSAIWLPAPRPKT